MTKALLRTPESGFTAFRFGRDGAFPAHLGQLKMASHALKHNGRRRLSASFNGGHQNITFSVVAMAKAEYNDALFPYEMDNDYGEYNRSLNIWWDVGRSPPPLNFDVSKIGVTVTEALRRLKITRPIYFRVYGNAGELLSVMAEETVRIFIESGFTLSGLELRNDSAATEEGTLMKQQLNEYFWSLCVPPRAVNMVVVDGETITAKDLDDFRRCGYTVFGVEPGQESVEGVWRWKPLVAGLA